MLKANKIEYWSAVKTPVQYDLRHCDERTVLRYQRPRSNFDLSAGTLPVLAIAR